MGHIIRNVAENLWRDVETGIYYAISKAGGRYRKRSLRTTDRQLASRRLVVFLAEDGPVDGRRGGVLEEVAAEWLDWSSKPPRVRRELRASTVFRKRGAIANLVDALPESLDDLTRETCDRWFAKRQKQVAARTINLELELLRGICRYATERGLLRADPSTGLSRVYREKYERHIPTLDQYTRLLADLRAHYRARAAADLIELLACSGLRLGEARSLHRGDVDLEGGTFTVRASKTDAGVRTVPIFPALRPVLDRLTKRKRPGARLVKIENSKVALIHACRRLGLPHYSHHTFRHFFITQCLRSKIEPGVIAKWVGHRDGGSLILRTYQHVMDDWSRERAALVTLNG